MNNLFAGSLLSLVLAVGTFAVSASAQTPGVRNGYAQTAGMNNAAVSDNIPGMDAGRSVIPPTGLPAGAARPGSMNNAAVTGYFIGFKAGRLPSIKTEPVNAMHRPTSGMNNDAVTGALPGMSVRREIPASN